MSQLVLAISNKHVSECDQPPTIDTSQSPDYIGYFENQFGEQWIFRFDRTTGRGTVRGGDDGWNCEHPVAEGRCDIILDDAESRWLASAWAAATGKPVLNDGER